MKSPDESDEYTACRAARWRGVVLRGWAERIGSNDPLAWRERYPNRTVRQRPGGTTWRVESEWGSLFVKHVSARYRTEAEGGWKLGKRIRWVLRRSPAMRLLRVTLGMRAKGIGAPRVLMVMTRGFGLTREELIVTESAGGRRMLGMAARHPDLADPLMRMLAEQVFQMHEAGIVHGHLLPGHMFIQPTLDRVVFIDNDENRLFPAPASMRDRIMNLEQLAHQVSPVYATWRAFFRRYFELSALPPCRWRPMLAQLLRRARRRESAGHRTRVQRARHIRSVVARWRASGSLQPVKEPHDA